MDLRGNQITVGELWDAPAARALLKRRLPVTIKQPPAGAGREVTLAQALSLAECVVPRFLLLDIVKELSRV